MRLKLFARNEVSTRSTAWVMVNAISPQRQMLQWITALEKAADTCQFVTKNRFDSFVPIRVNVAAQWLVDGVSLLLFFFISTDCVLYAARLHVEFGKSAHHGERKYIYP